MRPGEVEGCSAAFFFASPKKPQAEFCSVRREARGRRSAPSGKVCIT